MYRHPGSLVEGCAFPAGPFTTCEIRISWLQIIVFQMISRDPTEWITAMESIGSAISLTYRVESLTIPCTHSQSFGVPEFSYAPFSFRHKPCPR